MPKWIIDALFCIGCQILSSTAELRMYVCVFIYIRAYVWMHVYSYGCAGSSQSIPLSHSPLCLFR